MKNRFLLYFALMCSIQLSAQDWELLGIPGVTTSISSLSFVADTLYAGLDGDGVFRSDDGGENWSDISGNIATTDINDVRGAPGFLFAATSNGVFMTIDQANWVNNTSNLSFTDASYYSVGIGDSDDRDFAVCTNGGGVFAGPEMNGPWTAYNTGLTGDALNINDIAGYDNGTTNFIMVATNAGVFSSIDEFSTWTAINGGLSGNSLLVNRVMALGTLLLAASEGGFYYSLDFGVNWIPAIPGEPFNALVMVMDGPAFTLFAAGQNAYYSPNLTGFYPISLEGTTGQVVVMAANSTYLFIVTEDETAGRSTSLYRAPLSSIIVGVEEKAPEHVASLGQSYPNPADAYGIINYFLNKGRNVELKLYDLYGKKVQDLVASYMPEGQHSRVVNTAELPAGIYIYRLMVDNGIMASGKMVVAH